VPGVDLVAAEAARANARVVGLLPQTDSRTAAARGDGTVFVPGRRILAPVPAALRAARFQTDSTQDHGTGLDLVPGDRQGNTRFVTVALARPAAVPTAEPTVNGELASASDVCFATASWRLSGASVLREMLPPEGCRSQPDAGPHKGVPFTATLTPPEGCRSQPDAGPLGALIGLVLLPDLSSSARSAEAEEKKSRRFLR
jgi:hypothetical protein